MTMKEALADKEYRKRGGKFKFPSPMDTFIRGLHRRTSDLHNDWRERLQKETSGEAARTAAVAEMLLRLRWDDNDDRARARLSQMIARIWDALEGLDNSSLPPLSSALWLDEDSGALANDTCAAKVEVVVDDGVGSDSVPEDKNGPHSLPEAHAEQPDFQERAIASPGVIVGPAMQAVPAAMGKGSGRSHAGLAVPPDGRLVAKGKGKGVRGGYRAIVVGATEALAAMDEGLQAALDSLPTELRRRMDAFAQEAISGHRVKLPWTLKAKQRKALHLWAEMHGLEHKSFGYRGKRRLHLIVPGTCDAEQAEEDWEAED